MCCSDACRCQVALNTSCDQQLMVHWGCCPLVTRAYAAAARDPPNRRPRAGAAPAFDFSAPPVAVARDVEPLFGFVPELRVFGARLTGLHLALMAGALLLYGAKGLLLGAVVWAVYTLSQRPQGAHPLPPFKIAKTLQDASASALTG